MTKIIAPAYLERNDKVAVVAPAGRIDPEKITGSLQTITSWGLKLIEGENFLKADGYFSGTDEERLLDLQNMMDDPTIKAIFCMRGGYGITRIIDRLDLSGFLRHPKWIIGFSDITALHLKLALHKAESIHGIMPALFDPVKSIRSVKSLQDFLFGRTIELEWASNSHNICGSASGHLLGGNLSILVDSLGTKTAPDGTGSILFIEEVDEYLYKIDRMLMHLKRGGVLEKIKGLLVGHFSSVKDTKTPFGKTLEEIILEKVMTYNIPVAFGLPAGHDEPNVALPHNRIVNLQVTDNKTSLTF